MGVKLERAKSNKPESLRASTAPSVAFGKRIMYAEKG